MGANFPATQDIIKYVVDKGKSQTPRDKVGENFYNRGILTAVIVTEGIHNAQRLTGKKDIAGDEMRRGLESLRVSEARFKELGLPGFSPPFSVNCTDHNGHHSAYMQQWDGNKWVQVSDWIEPMKDKVMPLLEAAAADYVSKNEPWPKRTETCDKSS